MEKRPVQDSRERDKPRRGAVASSLTIIRAYATASEHISLCMIRWPFRTRLAWSKKSPCFKNKSNHASALRLAIHVIAEDFFALVDQSRARFSFHTSMAT
jgi:hypothetical protein